MVYNIGTSKLVRGDAGAAVAAATSVSDADAVAEAIGETAPFAAVSSAATTRTTLPAGLYLVATRTCPNCKFAAAQMDAAGISYEELLAEENVELAQRLGIMQAPTLLKVAQDGTVAATVGAAAVLQKVKALSAAALA